MDVEFISWPISTKECWRTGGPNLRPSAYQVEVHRTDLASRAVFVEHLEVAEWSRSDPSSIISKPIWAATWQNQQNECAPSEDSDQPGRPPSLISVFAVRMKKPCVLRYPLSTERRLWSDWVDAQADPSLCWAHMPLCCHVMAHIKIKANIWILKFNPFFPSCTRL